MSSQQYDFDLIVIGGGSGGYAAARTAAADGAKVAVIEGGPKVGGLCILRGCMPTKALLYAAEVLHMVRQAPLFGIHPGHVRIDFSALMARKDRLIGEFADYRSKQLSSGRFAFIRATAKFLDPHTLELNDGKRLTARHFVISTGSLTAPPPVVPGLSEVGFITSDEALELKELPKSLIILGGGAVAIEFAQFFQRLGTEVTVIQRSAQILRDFDSDVAEAVQEALRSEGLRIFTGTKLLRVGRTDGKKRIHFEQGGEEISLDADEILHGLGRSPNTSGLNLASIGVNTNRQGGIICDKEMRTSVPHIFAAGDCAGPYEIVHIAIQQGEVSAWNGLHPDQPKAMDYRLLTSIVFTDPQVATVGLTEATAKAGNFAYIKASYPFNDHGKSLIMEALHGFVKLLADPKTGEILGGAVVGPMGGELIHEISAAMAKRMTVHELAFMPHYHPTLAEIWTYPAEELADQVIK